MSQPLAKVTADLEAARGPDVQMHLSIHPSWFGSKVLISLPRNLNCALCSGGGCDRCERAGALSLRDRGVEPRAIQIVLPELPEANCDLCIRVPGEGGLAVGAEAALGRGHLLLVLRVAETSDGAITLCSSELQTLALRKQLMKRSLIMAAALILLFIGMLRLSGWL